VKVIASREKRLSTRAAGWTGLVLPQGPQGFYMSEWVAVPLRQFR